MGWGRGKVHDNTPGGLWQNPTKHPRGVQTVKEKKPSRPSPPLPSSCQDAIVVRAVENVAVSGHSRCLRRRCVFRRRALLRVSSQPLSTSSSLWSSFPTSYLTSGCNSNVRLGDLPSCILTKIDSQLPSCLPYTAANRNRTIAVHYIHWPLPFFFNCTWQLLLSVHV